MSEFEGRRGQIRERLNRGESISVEDALFLARAIDSLEAMVRERVTQVGQLKDRLRELEWACDETFCPICSQSEARGHAPTCWLAKEIRDV